MVFGDPVLVWKRLTRLDSHFSVHHSPSERKIIGYTRGISGLQLTSLTLWLREVNDAFALIIA